MSTENGRVTSSDLTGVVEDNLEKKERQKPPTKEKSTYDLSVERGGLLGGVVLGVSTDVSSSDVLDGDVLDAETKTSQHPNRRTKGENVLETDVVSGETSLELLVVHLDGLDFGGDVSGSEDDDHTGLDGSGLDSTDGHRSDSSNLVDILWTRSRASKRRIRRSETEKEKKKSKRDSRRDSTKGRGVKGKDRTWRGSRRGLSVGREGGSIASIASRRVFPLEIPALVSFCHPLNQPMLVDSSNMLSPCHPEMGTKATVFGLNPTFLIKLDVSLTISSYRASAHLAVSILLMATMSCRTPRVKARRACSRV